jgi:hypothetical protein
VGVPVAAGAVVPEPPPARPARQESRDEQAGQRRWADEQDEDYPPPSVKQHADLSEPYQIDLQRWFALAAKHWGALAVSAAGYLIAAVLISMPAAVLPCVNILGMLLLWPPLLAGVPVVALMQLRGESWWFGDFFGGFRYWGPLVANQLLLCVLAVMVMVPGLVLVFLLQASGRRGNEVLALSAAAALALGMLAMVYVLVRLQFFALPLMIDRNFDALDAMRGSWELSRGHVPGLVGLTVMMLLLNVAGALLCGVGLLLTYPFTVLVQCSGYWLIAGARPPGDAVSWGRIAG